MAHTQRKLFNRIQHFERGGDRAFRQVTTVAGSIVLAVLAAIAAFLLIKALPALNAGSAVEQKTIQGLTGGVESNFWAYLGPLVFGTLLAAGLALLLSFFISIGVALFITQYAPKPLARTLSWLIDLLAAIPSVVYGLWGALVLVPSMQPFWAWVNKYLGWIPLFASPQSNPPRTIATVSIILAIMILPIITSMARDILAQVPRSQIEGALALGATRWEMMRIAVVPFARNGMVSAGLLGLGRALGETMAVLMILSPGASYTWHLLVASKHQTIAANIANQFPEADAQGVSTLIATGLVLFVITFFINWAARRLTTPSGSQPTATIWQKFWRATAQAFSALLQRYRKASRSWHLTRALGKAPHAELTDTGSVAARKETGEMSQQKRHEDPRILAALVASQAHAVQYSRSHGLNTPSHHALPNLMNRSNVARQARNNLMTVLIYVCAAIAVLPLAVVLFTVLSNGITRLNWDFLTHTMRGVVGGLAPYGGASHAIIGTLEITLGAMLISLPIGIMAAIYLVEYSKGSFLSRTLSTMVGVMAGIPSIVAGLFSFSLFSIIGGPGTVNGFVGSCALSVLMIPTVITSTAAMLRVVPHDLREASYALGVTKTRTILHVVLPTALPGIVSGATLAVARVIGETAPLLITSGAIDSTNWNLFNGRMTSLPVYVYNEFQQGTALCPAAAAHQVPACIPGIRMERAWAAALVLIVIVLLLNIIARAIARSVQYAHNS